ncbi:Isoflavone reductase-like protein [Rhynchospora pubera]|uniref:Isoflavone reductase-like protein n=1 Tax=Rhynchospora pubera TaxID=906938 RepID=A0AAV8DBS9_9POAL|nr:Isoflavone reductase-like protein [Rhynchospora pubera]
MASNKSKILIIGGTGYIGKFVISASARLGYPTFALVRDTAPADPAKAKLLDSFKDSGVTLVKGDLYDHESLVKAFKAVDVVISTVGALQIADQTKIIAAIKEAGNIKRFLPSEFGNDVDRVHAVEPAKSIFALKASIRRAIEAEGIPYTYVSSNYFAGYFIPTLGQPAPPTDKVFILGDGNTKEAPIPLNIILSINYSVYIKGDHTNFEIEPSFGVEATELYPDVKYTTVEELIRRYTGN